MSAATSNIYNQFYVNVWAFIKSGTYPVPSTGVTVNDVPINMLLSCRHQPKGRFGLTLRGEVTNINALVPAQTAFTNISEFPNAMADTTLIKDLDTGNLYYCDTASYNANISQCNVATINPVADPVYTLTNLGGGNIQLNQPALTPNAQSYLLLVLTSSAPLPPVPGLTNAIRVYTSAGFNANTVVLPTGHTYYFNIKALGNPGYADSNWVQVVHTT